MCRDFFDDHAGSYFLFGPRGTGKSTWLRARYPDAAWIDLLDAETERTYYTRPERLTEFLAAHDGRRTVVIDEIQRVGILEDLLIATRIPVFRRRAKRSVVAHGKFYFFDCGVFRSLRPADLRGIKTFHHDYPEAARCCCTGAARPWSGTG